MYAYALDPKVSLIKLARHHSLQSRQRRLQITLLFLTISVILLLFINFNLLSENDDSESVQSENVQLVDKKLKKIVEEKSAAVRSSLKKVSINSASTHDSSEKIEDVHLSKEKVPKHSAITHPEYIDLIKKKAQSLKSPYVKIHSSYDDVQKQLWQNLGPRPYEDDTIVWNTYHRWQSKNEIYPVSDIMMGQMMTALRYKKITDAKIYQSSGRSNGSQLKLLLQLGGKQDVIFIPKWHEVDKVLLGRCEGKGRFNAEIIAFYLGAILDMRWTPIAVGRKINLDKIYNRYADEPLKRIISVEVKGNR